MRQAPGRGAACDEVGGEAVRLRWTAMTRRTQQSILNEKRHRAAG